MISKQLIGAALVVLMSSLGAVLANELNNGQSFEETPDMSHVFVRGDTPWVGAIVSENSGKQVQFEAPYFDKTMQPLPLGIKEFSNRVFRELMSHARTIISSALIEHRSGFVLAGQITKTVAQLGLRVRSFSSESKRLNARYNREKSGVQLREAVSLLPELMRKAEQEMIAEAGDKLRVRRAKEEAKLARAETGRRILLLMDGLEQLVVNSPIGTGLKFDAVLVDGESLFDELVEKVKFMRYAGFGFALARAKDVCNLVLRTMSD